MLTASDYFSRYLFAIPIRKLDIKSAVDALLDIVTKHAFKPKHVITDNGAAFTSQVIEELISKAWNKVCHATVKHELQIQRNSHKYNPSLSHVQSVLRP